MTRHATTVLCVLLLIALRSYHVNAGQKPNIVVILADDLGCGDVDLEFLNRSKRFLSRHVARELRKRGLRFEPK